jgi:phosphohistidine phosphatase
MLDCRRIEIDAFSAATAAPKYRPMRRLLLLRHAKAQRSLPGMPDRDRALIARGRKDAVKIGAYMAARALVPERVLLSPVVRTQETWKFVAKAFKPAPGAGMVEKLYDATPHCILAVIKDIPATVHTALIVGHNPGLHELALMLIAAGDLEARERLREKLPTCGLVIVDFAFDDWNRLHPCSGRLEHFVTPKSLEAMAN